MTIIPVPWKEGEDLNQVARSISFFPLIGLLIGLLNCAVFFLCVPFFSPFFSSVVIVISWIFITGGLHLDGLADTADGVWGGNTQEQRLEIMKDSRTGVFGVLTLISFILLKTAGLNELLTLQASGIPRILISLPVIGRWISVFSIYFFTTARKEGLGSFFKEHIGLKELLVSLVLTLVIIFSLIGVPGLVTLVLVTVFAAISSLFFKSRLGGLTGDIYGALCESSELFSLITLLILCINGLLI
jgi:adenosylcobinamide-GDP ribazoletransferase